MLEVACATVPGRVVSNTVKPEIVGLIGTGAAFLATVLVAVRFKLWLLKTQRMESALRSQMRMGTAASVRPTENDDNVNALRTSIRRRAGIALVILLSILGAFVAAATCICLASTESDLGVLMVTLGAVVLIPQAMFISWLVATRRFYRSLPGHSVA